MDSITSGSFRLFQLAGITVYLNWFWFPWAFFQIQARLGRYESPVWPVLEYLALFGIVLIHEFGHALACRQVGGKADTIVLWPLGGVAFVDPPPRPGAVLWSIAAGPLVNVVLLPITIAAYILARIGGLADTSLDAFRFVEAVAGMNFLLLVFNMLPIYPLDGGQILQSLLWFVMGRARSLMVASGIGLGVGVVVVGVALLSQNYWITIMALFVAWRSWAGFTAARSLLRAQPAIDLINQCQQHLRNHDYDQAIAACDQALTLLRDAPAGLAVVLQLRSAAHRAKGNLAQAIADLNQAVELNPTAPNYTSRGEIERAAGSYHAALADYSEAIRLEPDYAPAWNSLAWLLATCPKPEVRNGARAVEAAKKACELTGWKQPECLGTLAAAYAEAGQFAEAMEWQKNALESVDYRQRREAEAQKRLQLYAEGKPYRDEVQASESATA